MTVPTIEDRFQPVLANGSLTLHDGRILDVDSAEVYSQALEKVPNNREMRVREAQRARRLLDIPTPPSTTHPIAVILFYKSLGVLNEEICDVLKITEDRLDGIIASEDYKILRQMFFQAIAEGDMQDVQLLFQKHSYDAAIKMVALAQNQDDDDMAFKASKDLLDRAGHRPVDKVQHEHKHSGGLSIRYITDERNDDIIDVDAMEVE